MSLPTLQAGRQVVRAKGVDQMRQETCISRAASNAVAILVAALVANGPADAQQGAGVRASPSATTTIEGEQIPPQPPKFGGVIKESAKDSKTWWPPRVVPPKGAPNVLLIMTDDQGYGVT